LVALQRQGVKDGCLLPIAATADAVWAATAEEATAKMLGFARELHWKIEIVPVDPVKPDA
jgi:hypothetical protein